MYETCSAVLLEPTSWSKVLKLYIELKYQTKSFSKQFFSQYSNTINQASRKRYLREVRKLKKQTIDRLEPIIKKDKIIFEALKKFEQERDIEIKTKYLLKIETTRSNLHNCGNKNIIHKLYCKECKNKNQEALLLEEVEKKVSCNIKYCQKPKCVKTRYAKIITRLYQTFFQYPNKKGKRVWRKIKPEDEIMHCSLSPLPCYIKDSGEIKKKLLAQSNHLISVLNKGSPCPRGYCSYLKTITTIYEDAEGVEHKTSYKLRFRRKFLKNGKVKEVLVFQPMNLRGIKAFDIVYHHQEGKIRPHYHFAIIPNNKKDFIPIALIQYIRKEIESKARNKIKTQLQFHLGDKKNRKEHFGYKPAKSVIIYITKRAIGAFGKADKYKEEDLENKKIETIFEDKGVYGYQDFISVEDYVKYFHNQKTISYFGKSIKRKYTCNDRQFIENRLPLECKLHGDLSNEQIEYSRSEELINPPPPKQRNLWQYQHNIISLAYHNIQTGEKLEGSLHDIYKKVNDKRELDRKIIGALQGMTYTKEEEPTTFIKQLPKISPENQARIDDINNCEFQNLISKTYAEEQERRNYYKKVFEINKKPKFSMKPELRKELDEKFRKLERLEEYQETGKFKLSVDDCINIAINGRC